MYLLFFSPGNFSVLISIFPTIFYKFKVQIEKKIIISSVQYMYLLFFSPSNFSVLISIFPTIFYKFKVQIEKKSSSVLYPVLVMPQFTSPCLTGLLYPSSTNMASIVSFIGIGGFFMERMTRASLSILSMTSQPLPWASQGFSHLTVERKEAHMYMYSYIFIES